MWLLRRSKIPPIRLDPKCHWEAINLTCLIGSRSLSLWLQVKSINWCNLLTSLTLSTPWPWSSWQAPSSSSSWALQPLSYMSPFSWLSSSLSSSLSSFSIFIIHLLLSPHHHHHRRPWVEVLRANTRSGPFVFPVSSLTPAPQSQQGICTLSRGGVYWIIHLIPTIVQFPGVNFTSKVGKFETKVWFWVRSTQCFGWCTCYLG